MGAKRHGWTRLRGGTGGVWKHDYSPWHVMHCGRPTALWPYFAYNKDTGERMIAPNGRGFRLLSLGQDAVEERFQQEKDRACDGNTKRPG